MGLRELSVVEQRFHAVMEVLGGSYPGRRAEDPHWRCARRKVVTVHIEETTITVHDGQAVIVAVPGRWCIPWDPATQEIYRHKVAKSFRLKPTEQSGP